MARLAAGPWGEEKATGFVKALTKQELILGRLGEIYNRLLLGEIFIAATLTDSEIKADKNKNAPVAHAEAVSPVISPAYNAGVPKNANASSGVNTTYSPVMNTVLATVVSSSPAVCRSQLAWPT